MVGLGDWQLEEQQQQLNNQPVGIEYNGELLYLFFLLAPVDLVFA